MQFFLATSDFLRFCKLLREATEALLASLGSRICGLGAKIGRQEKETTIKIRIEQDYQGSRMDPDEDVKKRRGRRGVESVSGFGLVGGGEAR